MRTKKGSFVCEKFDSEWMHDGKQGFNYVHWGVPVVDIILEHHMVVVGTRNNFFNHLDGLPI